MFFDDRLADAHASNVLRSTKVRGCRCSPGHGLTKGQPSMRQLSFLGKMKLNTFDIPPPMGPLSGGVISNVIISGGPQGSQEPWRIYIYPHLIYNVWYQLTNGTIVRWGGIKRYKYFLISNLISNMISNLISNIISNLISNIISKLISNIISNMISNTISHIISNLILYVVSWTMYDKHQALIYFIIQDAEY